jgi:hypothetical protein
MIKRRIRGTIYFLLGCCLLSSCTSSGSEGLGAYPKAVAAADESSAIMALRTIASAQLQAKAMRNSYENFDTLVQLGFLDQRFAGANPVMRGYRFAISANASQFSVTADPELAPDAPPTRSRHFYLDSTDNTIHVNAAQTATHQDPAL